jgi:hypothetical protein
MSLGRLGEKEGGAFNNRPPFRLLKLFLQMNDAGKHWKNLCALCYSLARRARQHVCVGVAPKSGQVLAIGIAPGRRSHDPAENRAFPQQLDCHHR